MYTAAQCKIVLDPKEPKPQKFIKLRVSFEREWRTFSIPSKEKFTKEDFEKGSTKRVKEVLNIAENAKYQAQRICEDLGGGFTFTEFKLRYQQLVFGKEYSSGSLPLSDLDAFFDAYVQKKSIKPSTQVSYKSAIAWIKRFDPNATIQSLTSTFIVALKEYIISTILRETGKEPSINTIGIYLRAIKALCKEAEKQNLLKEQPFVDIRITHAPRLKRAIPVEDWAKFTHYEPKNAKLEFAHNFAILTFALCGANLTDILSLKNKNISNDGVCFVRQKTERVDTKICVPFLRVTRNIFKKYGSLSKKRPDDYIFPFYANLSEKQQNAKRNDILKKINEGIAIICKELSIEKFTTYNIRHTFAILARDNGEFSAEQLMMFLGHKNITTTQHYLKSISTPLVNKMTDWINNMIEEVD